jgi:hypothetical protein
MSSTTQETVERRNRSRFSPKLEASTSKYASELISLLGQYVIVQGPFWIPSDKGTLRRAGIMFVVGKFYFYPEEVWSIQRGLIPTIRVP